MESSIKILLIKTMESSRIKDELIEELANLEHEQWMDWSKSIHSTLKVILHSYRNDKEGLEYVINRIDDRLKRWEKLWIPYEDLSEEMKEEDRVYARKVLKILNSQKKEKMDREVKPDYKVNHLYKEV